MSTNTAGTTLASSGSPVLPPLVTRLAMRAVYPALGLAILLAVWWFGG